jgi:hypothetical protein
MRIGYTYLLLAAGLLVAFGAQDLPCDQLIEQASTRVQAVSFEKFTPFELLNVFKTAQTDFLHIRKDCVKTNDETCQILGNEINDLLTTSIANNDDSNLYPNFKSLKYNTLLYLPICASQKPLSVDTFTQADIKKFKCSSDIDSLLKYFGDKVRKAKVDDAKARTFLFYSRDSCFQNTERCYVYHHIANFWAQFIAKTPSASANSLLQKVGSNYVKTCALLEKESSTIDDKYCSNEVQSAFSGLGNTHTGPESTARLVAALTSLPALYERKCLDQTSMCKELSSFAGQLPALLKMNAVNPTGSSEKDKPREAATNRMLRYNGKALLYHCTLKIPIIDPSAPFTINYDNPKCKGVAQPFEDYFAQDPSSANFSPKKLQEDLKKLHTNNLFKDCVVDDTYSDAVNNIIQIFVRFAGGAMSPNNLFAILRSNYRFFFKVAATVTCSTVIDSVRELVETTMRDEVPFTFALSLLRALKLAVFDHVNCVERSRRGNLCIDHSKRVAINFPSLLFAGDKKELVQRSKAFLTDLNLLQDECNRR